MKILKFDTQEEWLEARRGKITGSSLKDIVVKRGTEMKKGYWELIADKLVDKNADSEILGENPMDRGHRLEEEAIEIFRNKTGKKVDSSLMMWVSDLNENMAISPDGSISKKEAIEVKCLGSASHVEALVTQKVPKEYQEQITQYFVINDDLKTVYMCFYDPRMMVHNFFFLTIKREDMAEDIDFLKEYQQNILKSVDETVNKLMKIDI